MIATLLARLHLRLQLRLQLRKPLIGSGKVQLRRKHKLLPVITLGALLSGCSSVGYYAQAVGGHLSLMSKRQPLDEVMASEDTDAEIRRKLELLRDARVFAVDKLGLPDNDSYNTFVKTGKRFITWNVVATPEFSMAPKQWCFPVAGCVSYRGYFDEKDAEGYQSFLDNQGFDTQLGGASAYSTLGWFNDPLMDTMLHGSDIRLVGLLFHELAHQVLYVKNDSSFNEAFATFVEQQGSREWLIAEGKADRVPFYEAYLDRQIDFNALLQLTRSDLVTLYQDAPAATAKELDDSVVTELRERKEGVFEMMRVRYETLKTDQWDGFDGYDNWFKREMNNARLIAVSTYLKWVPAFAELFNEAGSDFNSFYTRAKELSEKPYAERQEALENYLEGSKSASAD